jgi:hypothetical protein
MTEDGVDEEPREEVAPHPYGRPAEGPVDLDADGDGRTVAVGGDRTEGAPTRARRERPPVDAVDDVYAAPAARELGVEEARRRFGGLDVPASIVGMLTALALLTLLAGLVGAAVGAIGYQAGLSGNEAKLSIGGLAGGVVALFVAYFVGGWAAGRIARYDGVRNGVMTGGWTLVLAAVLAGLGAWLGSEYNVFSKVDLPSWFSRDALTLGAIVSGVVAVVAMLAGGALGGARGARYHLLADAEIVNARPGGVSRA